MDISTEMKEMVDYIRENEKELKNGASLPELHYAPNISEKLLNTLITKTFDYPLPINKIVAVLDESLFSNGKDSVVFTTTGIFAKEWGVGRFYVNYSDINSMRIDNSTLHFSTKSYCGDLYLVTSCDTVVLRRIIEEFRRKSKEKDDPINDPTRVLKKRRIPNDIKKKCHAIIHTASTACGGVGTGLAQLPMADNVVITPIQIGMIIGLGHVFELDISESTAKAMIVSAGATIAGRSITQVLWGWIPIIGNAINTATAAGLTEVIGWMAVSHFYARWLDDKEKGRFEGMKEGYNSASDEYEKKLRQQAEEFLRQKKDFTKERDAYEQIIDEYEEYIRELEEKHADFDKIRENKSVLKELKDLRETEGNTYES